MSTFSSVTPRQVIMTTSGAVDTGNAIPKPLPPGWAYGTGNQYAYATATSAPSAWDLDTSNWPAPPMIEDPDLLGFDDSPEWGDEV